MKGRRHLTDFAIHETIRVIKGKNGDWRVQQQLREPYVIAGVPDGYFCIIKGRVFCPKKRGEKVLVTYTAVHEEEI